MKMQNKLKLSVIAFIYLFGITNGESSLPVVIWHGMGDSCCFSFSMGAIKDLIEQEVPSIYVRSIRIGSNEIVDVEKSYFGNINEQVRKVCEQLAADEKLRNGYNAIGFSQGAQFIRAVAQRCSYPPVKNLISIGGQHQGVYGIPVCGTLTRSLCDYMRRKLKYGAYLRFVQESLIQSSYWHDPTDEADYKKNNLFLAEINNEIYVNQTYVENMKKLNTFALVKFRKDTMVTPSESEWFGFFKPGQSEEIQTLPYTDLFLQDRLGLKTLHESGKLDFLEVDGNHLQFTDTWFIDNIIKKYLI